MKRLLLIILTVILMVGTCFTAATAERRYLASTYSCDGAYYLSPDNKCIITPVIYSNRRFRDVGKESAYDLKQDFSASRIKQLQGSREFGLYLKFTPGKADSGYYISRFDIVISDKYGNALFTEGFRDDMLCEYGRYWYWNFYSLQDYFDGQIRNNGWVTTGTFTMDIYFNGYWAGKTSFKVTN